MKPRSRSPDLPRGQRERDETAGIVRAVDVLTDAHAPEDDGCAGTRVKARDLTQRFRVDPADRRHLFGRERTDTLLQSFEILRVAGDVLFVVEFFRNND